MMFMIGVGMVVVGASLLERHLIKSGKAYEAEIVSLLFGVGLPITGIGGAIYVMVKTAKTFLLF